MKKRKRGLFWLLIVLLLGVMAYSGYRIYEIRHAYAVGGRSYDALARQYVQKQRPEPPTQASNDTTGETQEPEETAPISVDFTALCAENPDVVGWLYCEGTPINYPVLQAEDNSFYLRRLLDGTYNVYGSIFMDYRSARDLSDENTLVYGHSIRSNNEMFTSLSGYLSQEYYEAHPTMYYLTPERAYRLELFSGYKTNAESDAYRCIFEDEADFSAFLTKITDASAFASNIKPTTQDRIMTLSTCTNQTQSGRYVVHGVLIPLTP